MKTCYLVQTHREPSQILRLVRVLLAGSPDARVVVCHDASAGPLDAAIFQGMSGCELIFTRGPVRRSEFSMVDAYLDAVHSIHRMGIEYDWLTLLSGQDYPIKPLARYERHLQDAECEGFLSFGDVLTADSPWATRPRQGRRRYFYRYWRLTDQWWPWLRRLHILNKLTSVVHVQATHGPYIGVRRWRHPFKDGMRCYGGSAWHTLSRRCVEFLLEARGRGDILVDYFRKVQSPEEAFYQTMLVNGGRFKLCNDNLRYIDFTGESSGSPRTLTLEDFTTLERSPAYFARKFDIRRDERILDAIDERLLRASNVASTTR